MIPHEALRAAIRSKGFRYKDQRDRVELWKQAGTTKRVELRRVDLHDARYARAVLRQAGMSAEEIDAFIAEEETGIE